MSSSITFNGKTSASFGLTVTKIERPAPKKCIVRQKIPYSNYDPDFSRITGSYTYERRTLKYQFVCKAASEKLLADLISEVEEWLLEAPAGILTESIDSAYYYADCTCDDVTSAYISPTAARITATLTAYPYRRSFAKQEQNFIINPTSTIFTFSLSGTKPMRPLFTSSANEIIYVNWGSARYIIPPNVVQYQISRIVFSPGNNTFSARTTESPATLKIECIEEVI